MIKEKIIDAIFRAVNSSDGEVKTIINKAEIVLNFSSDLQFGDYSTNIAMRGFGTVPTNIVGGKLHRNPSNISGTNPKMFADNIKVRLSNDEELGKITEKIEVAGPGFINFWLKKDVLVSNLIQIDEKKEKYGMSDINKGKLAIVEYSSANIAKPFTIGHLRSTIIGDAVANLLEATSWKVMRDNHLGDWGTQFGKQICAIKHWGDMEKISESENPVKELVALYVKFHEEAEKDPSLDDEARSWFKKLEDGDTEARSIWQKCIDWSFIEFDRIYGVLGVKFNQEFEKGRGLGESFFENRMAPIIQELKVKKLLKEGEGGAQLVFFKDEKYPPAMILKKDGATLYHTRDLATDKYRLDKYNPDLIINEVGLEQKLYFEQLIEIEKLLEWFKPGQRYHLGHGLVRFKDGKMSTRKGNVIWMDDVLQMAITKARDMRLSKKSFDENNSNNPSDMQILENDKVVAIGALKYNDLKRDPKGEIVFDWDEILNMEGNSGPYLQYTIARTNSVLAKISNFKFQISNLNTEVLDTQEITVLRLLTRFSEVVEVSATTYSPNILCNYLYELSQKFNSFYASNKVIGSENENFRLALTSATGQVLKNGLKLLGIESPDKM